MDNSDFQKQVLKQERFRSTMSGLQTSMSVLQTAAAAHMSRQLSEMRQQNADALAMQQQMVEQEQIQAEIEEFIYTAQKFLTSCDAPDCNLEVTERYLRVRSIFSNVKEWGLGTPMIKGRDNKSAFESMLAHAQASLSALEKHKDVQELLAWMKAEEIRAEQERLRLEQKQKAREAQLAAERAASQAKKDDLQRRIKALQQQRRILSKKDWYIMNGMVDDSLKATSIPVSENERRSFTMIMWVFGGFAVIPICYLFRHDKTLGFKAWYADAVDTGYVVASLRKISLDKTYKQNKERLELEWNQKLDQEIAGLQQELSMLNVAPGQIST